MSGPFGEPTNRAAPAKKPRLEPVDLSRGLWKDQQGRYETWIDPDTRKPIQPPKKDTTA